VHCTQSIDAQWGESPSALNLAFLQRMGESQNKFAIGSFAEDELRTEIDAALGELEPPVTHYAAF
jgi:hypothetical protein